jgi:hypothetical protein
MGLETNLICYYDLIPLQIINGIQILLFNSLFMMVDIKFRICILITFVIFIGTLKRASFDTKTFANEMCRLICESTSDNTKQAIVLSTMSPRIFTDFEWYCGE